MGPKEKQQLIVALVVIFIGGLICLGIYTSYVPLLKQYGNPLEGFNPGDIDKQMKNFQSPLKVFNGTP